jgi:hypothetical protein
MEAVCAQVRPNVLAIAPARCSVHNEGTADLSRHLARSASGCPFFHLPGAIFIKASQMLYGCFNEPDYTETIAERQNALVE